MDAFELLDADLSAADAGRGRGTVRVAGKPARRLVTYRPEVRPNPRSGPT